MYAYNVLPVSRGSPRLPFINNVCKAVLFQYLWINFILIGWGCPMGQIDIYWFSSIFSRCIKGQSFLLFSELSGRTPQQVLTQYLSPSAKHCPFLVILLYSYLVAFLSIFLNPFKQFSVSLTGLRKIRGHF